MRFEMQDNFSLVKEFSTRMSELSLTLTGNGTLAQISEKGIA
jgi:hypothetical protein